MNKTICSNHYSIFEMFTQWWLYSQLYLRIHGFYSITYPCFFSITYTCLRTVITYPFFLLYSLTTFPAYLLIHVSYILLIYVSLSIFPTLFTAWCPPYYSLIHVPYYSTFRNSTFKSHMVCTSDCGWFFNTIGFQFLSFSNQDVLFGAPTTHIDIKG